VNDLLLPVFPQGALSGSVITTVWIGVAVVTFFNLRLGWVLSGLVVPGYLVPLLIVKPWAVAVIFFESTVTYLLAWFFSEYLSRFGVWGSLFGRDRFFAIILFSVVVRLVFDGWLLPELGQWMNEELNLVFDYRNNLHSFGLVIIALMANLYWKTGFLRGLIPLFVTVGITYIIVRYGLMEFTNFTISNLSYMYEDIAASILASPKAYLILLIVAFLASRMNLLYGWDFSGILIPSLLALQWYQPQKLLTSFVEAFVILLVASWLMRTRLLRNANIEGARKLLLFFNIGFAYKIVLGYLLLYFMPEVKITDSYAFGYLLSTLMAVKIHDKDIAARFTRATLQTSFVGVLVASILGFSLTLLPLQEIWSRTSVSLHTTEVERTNNAPLGETLRNDKVLLYQTQQAGSVPVPLTGELETFAAALTALKRHIASDERSELALAIELLDTIGYQILELEGRYLYLRERQPVKGWGLYIIDRQATGRLVVEIPVPLNERGTFEAGLALFNVAGARALAIGGAKRDINPDGSADVLINRQTFFQVFHRNMAQRDVIQVRRYTTEMARLTRGIRPGTQQADRPEPMASLWVKKNLPPGLDLVMLKGLVEEVRIEWRGLPVANRQRETAYGGFAELVLSQRAVRKLRARAIGGPAEPQQQISEQRIDGFLAEWLSSEKGGIAERGSDAYVVPRLDELLYFDEEVVTPLLNAARSGYLDGEWTGQGLQELLAVQAAAKALDYSISRYRHRQTGQDYLILFEESDTPRRRHWGTYVFRVGPAAGYMVQVPRPLYEINSFEYGIALFERLEARALMIAGADPGANLDGSADLVRNENMRSLFSAVSQAVLREAGDDPLLVVHSRARGYRPDLPQTSADALLSVVGDVGGLVSQSPLLQRLVEVLQADGLSHELVDGRAATAGYEVGNIPQSLYLQATRNKLFSAIWLSPQARASYAQQDDQRQESLRFRALGIASTEQDLGEFVRQHRDATTKASLPGDLRAAIRRYQNRSDVVTLARIREHWPGYRWQRVIDRDSRQSFLAVFGKNNALALLANLNPRQQDAVIQIDAHGADGSAIKQFLNTRAALLEFGEMR
jgi:hypothetical protein